MSAPEYLRYKSRPTGQDVHRDAMRILEELLEERTDKNFRNNGKVRRIKTTGPEIRISSNNPRSEIVVTRSNTVPSNYREAVKIEPKQTEIESFLSEPVIEQTTPSDFGGSGSSADTEDNLSSGSGNRHKKSFLKRAKERILFALRRDQKGVSGKGNRKSSNETADSKHQMNGTAQKKSKHVKVPKGDGGNPDKDGPVISQPVKKGKGNIWNSFRRKKKLSRVTGDAYHQTDTTTGRRHQDNTDGKDISEKERIPSINESHTNQDIIQPHSPDKSPTLSDGVPSIPSPSSKSSNVTVIADKTPASNDDIPHIENSSQTPASKVSRIWINILDFPGDDIEFIDASDSERREKRGAGIGIKHTKDSPVSNIPFNGGKDLLDMKHPPSSAPFRVHLADIKTGGVFFKQTPGGATTPTRITVPTSTEPEEKRNLVYDDIDGPTDEIDGPWAQMHDLPDRQGRLHNNTSGGPHNEEDDSPDKQTGPPDELDGPPDEMHHPPGEIHGPDAVAPVDPQNPAPNLDAVYSEIAQKLIDIGDAYSSSGSEEKPKSGPQETQKTLSSLETEIIECLRSVGDNATREMKEDIYKRFRSTMQNCLGSELSWNTVALLFYTTREVVSAVGRGSRAALLVRDFTLQYVNDDFAPWISDQGGFDSLLSSEESDFGVD